MDESSLVKAHDHAKAASNAQHQSETTVAINEHALAAGEFANAARSTSSIEALRTLKLLEEHHQRLAELLKIPFDRRAAAASQNPSSETIDEKHESQASDATSDVSSPDDGRTKSGSGQQQQSAGGSPVATAKGVPSLAQQRRYPSREMTSSIASNLASARGIRGSRNRSQPIPPSVTNDQAPGNMEVQPRRDGSRTKMQSVLDQSGKPGWIPPTADSPRRETEPRKTEEVASPAASDDGYSRFYSTFGNIINRLSAPLAFAGLPLITEESSSVTSSSSVPEPHAETPPEPAPAKRSNRLKPSPAAPAEPDLSKIYSRATLRAISASNPNDSFYVVPTSGHTMSYANILNFADKEKRRLEASLHSGVSGGGGGAGDSLIEDDEDDFVDARESPSMMMAAPTSPGVRRRGTAAKPKSEQNLKNTVEELYLENRGLKDMLDKLSKRLHAFEATAQNSSLALAESIRLRRPGSPATVGASPFTSGGGGGGGMSSTDAVLKARNKELEEQMAMAMQRMEALEKENRTMARTLEKYREKWEKLKAGAKARRQAQGGAGESAEADESAAAAS
ncbi:hypothetical protein HER10_EVM0010126 [Colletotrichum scovillei]|uniref:MIT-like protein n=1 Tax=Colletotrichum scovillei TaxID=1209932 RepID=A0A9P7QZK7_9PEZI|nr:uncharacterized protein HER10_EVM0010126 [Colletotrichum scovillei]KAF4778763.1 hypothetical protein HER10_EVM0010126 [Colletotrichum scovillei]KAG7043971.1 MIT-like protein [Colletotrichum scovillei]KAG7046109.1 MIT-like protein [Colletotrichum scovillei]KAG7063420.1 MIT-like protein [Colletotrichum scovillei]